MYEHFFAEIWNVACIGTKRVFGNADLIVEGRERLAFEKLEHGFPW